MRALHPEEIVHRRADLVARCLAQGDVHVERLEAAVLEGADSLLEAFG